MNENRTERSRQYDIDSDEEAFEKAHGVSRAGLREIEMCPFVDELTRIGHPPVEVLEAEYLAEQARRNQALVD